MECVLNASFAGVELSAAPMIFLIVAAVAAHVVAFPSGLYGWLYYVNSSGGGSKATGSAVKRSAEEAEDVTEGAEDAKDAGKHRAKRRHTAQVSAVKHGIENSSIQDASGASEGHSIESSSVVSGVNPKISKHREQEVLMAMRSEREREHVKLLCDLAANQDLGVEVTDAAKQLVLEFLKKPREYYPGSQGTGTGFQAGQYKRKLPL